MKAFSQNGNLLCALMLGGIFLGACSPKGARGYDKYAYLIKDREDRTAPTSTEAPAPPSQDLPRWERVSHVEEWRENPIQPEEDFSDVEQSPKKGKRVGQKIVKAAEAYLGVPYRYGGMSRKGMDCSGLVCKAYEAVDIALPRSSSSQAKAGKKVSMKKVQPGDLVFFSGSKSSSRISHVGIVASVSGSKIEFIHASTSRGVRYDRLDEGYWRPLFQQAITMR